MAIGEKQLSLAPRRGWRKRGRYGTASFRDFILTRFKARIQECEPLKLNWGWSTGSMSLSGSVFRPSVPKQMKTSNG
jgi:hypothetical protein